MIKIDTNNFDWQIINNLFRDKPEVFLDQLIVKVDNYISCASRNEYVLQFLKTRFIENRNVSVVKVSEYLLYKNPREIINEFLALLSNLLPATEKDWPYLYYSWPVVKSQILKMKGSTSNANILCKRKELVTQIINVHNIHLFSGISAHELHMVPKRNTIYSSKKRIEAIKLNEFKKLDEAVDHFANIFDYKSFSIRFRHELLLAMKIDVCPYCNRQYVTNFECGDGDKATADIDHYYNKAAYPFLALSLYNFVPSCHICNSRFKLDKDFYNDEHIYPYDMEFGTDCRFKFTSPSFLIGYEPKYSLINSSNSSMIENSIKTFHLKEIYMSHKDYVNEIVKKYIIYTDYQLKDYLESFPGLFKDESEMLRIVFGNYSDHGNLGKRPLSKLTKDLLLDLGLKKYD